MPLIAKHAKSNSILQLEQERNGMKSARRVIRRRIDAAAVNIHIAPAIHAFEVIYGYSNLEKVGRD